MNTDPEVVRDMIKAAFKNTDRERLRDMVVAVGGYVADAGNKLAVGGNNVPTLAQFLAGLSKAITTELEKET